MEYRLQKNKAGYTATLVAYWWAGAVLEVTRVSWQEQYAQNAKNAEKVKRGPTDGPTDQSTDGPT